MKPTTEELRDLIATQKRLIKAIQDYRLDMSCYYGVALPNGVDIDALAAQMEKEVWRVMQFHVGRRMDETDRRATKLPGKKCTPEMMANIRMTKREPLA